MCRNCQNLLVTSKLVTSTVISQKLFLQLNDKSYLGHAAVTTKPFMKAARFPYTVLASNATMRSLTKRLREGSRSSASKLC